MTSKNRTLLLAGVLAVALAGHSFAGLVRYLPGDPTHPLQGWAGYSGFTDVISLPLVSNFLENDPVSGHSLSGTITSAVLRDPSTMQYLFYYNISVDVGSDPIEAFQLSSFNPPLYTQGIAGMGYNTAVTGSDPLLIPTEGQLYVPPGLPWAKYLFDAGDGVPAGQTTEVFYLAGSSTQVVTGTGLVINSVSAPAGVVVNVYGPPQAPIPEPATVALLTTAGLGLILGWGTWRKR